MKLTKIRSARLASFSVTLILFACNHSSSKLSHKLGELTWSPDSFQWAGISKEDFLREQLIRRGGSVKELSSPASVSAELNRIALAIDKKAREIYPNQLLNTPTPEVIVVDDDGVFAEALSASICVDSGSKKEGARTEVPYLRIDPSGWLSEENPKFVCPKTSAQLSDLSALIRTFNQNVDPSCMVQDVAGVLSIPKTCEAVDFNAKKIVYEASAPFIKITAGLVKKISEAEMYGILAHEIAHYYRSHSFWEHSNRFGFFYFRDHGKLRERPTADLEGKAKLLAEDLAKVVYMRLIAKQFPEENFPGTLAVFLSDPDTQNRLAAYPGCETFAAKENDEVRLDISRFILSGSKLGVESIAFYRDLSDKFEACLKRNSPFSPEIKDSLTRAISLIFESRELPFSFSGFDELKAHYVASYEEKINLRSALLERAREEGLSWYTTEQEADEMSLELLNLLGISPKVSGKALYSVSNSRDSRDLNGLSEDQCLILQENGWKIEGRNLNLFYGDLNDPHHSTCFRQWNIASEVEAHQYQGPFTFSSALTWQTMQEDLSKVVLASANGQLRRGHAFMGPAISGSALTRPSVLSCGYAQYPRFGTIPRFKSR